jgi:hypothetical protein
MVAARHTIRRSNVAALARNHDTMPDWAPSRLRPVAVAGACLILALASMLGLWGSDASRAAGLTLFMALVTIGVLRYERRRAGRAGLVSPISLFFVFWMLFIFGVGLSEFGPAGHDALLPGGTHELVVAYLVAAGALALVAIGYYAATHGIRFPQTTELRLSAPLSRSTVYVVLLVGWTSRVIRFQQGSFGYLGFGTISQGFLARLLQLADGLLPFVLAAVALELWQSRPVNPRWHRVLLTTNVVALALVSIGSGVKGQLLIDLIPIGLVYVITHGRLPLRAVLVIALLLVVEYGGVQAFRADISTGTIASPQRRGVVSTVGAVTGRIAQSWGTTPPQHHFVEAWDGVKNEYSATIRTLAIVLHDTPKEEPYIGDRRLVVAPFVFLPTRALGGFPTNPGPYVSTAYLRSTPTSSTTATQPGDFFMSGGWPAVVLGELLVGIVIGLTWRLTVRANSPRGWVMYAVLATTFTNGGLEWYFLTRTLVEFTIVYLPVARLLFPRSSHQQDPNVLRSMLGSAQPE